VEFLTVNKTLRIKAGQGQQLAQRERAGGKAFIDASHINALAGIAHFTPVNTEGGDQIEICRLPAQFGAAIHVFINGSRFLIETGKVEIIHR